MTKYNTEAKRIVLHYGPLTVKEIYSQGQQLWNDGHDVFVDLDGEEMTYLDFRILTAVNHNEVIAVLVDWYQAQTLAQRAYRVKLQRLTKYVAKKTHQPVGCVRTRFTELRKSLTVE